MKFFLDANLNVNLADPLRSVFLEHEFVTAFHLGLNEEDDTPLFSKVREQGFDFFVTHDRNQLRRLGERRALWESKLHWIGIQAKSRPGPAGIALEMATLTAGLPHILDDVPAEPMCATTSRAFLPRRGSE